MEGEEKNHRGQRRHAAVTRVAHRRAAANFFRIEGELGILLLRIRASGFLFIGVLSYFLLMSMHYKTFSNVVKSLVSISSSASITSSSARSDSSRQPCSSAVVSLSMAVLTARV